MTQAEKHLKKYIYIYYDSHGFAWHKLLKEPKTETETINGERWWRFKDGSVLIWCDRYRYCKAW